jgi:hypothetical protein
MRRDSNLREGVGWTGRPETEDGVQLQDVQPGSILHVITQHTCYTIRMLFGRIALISGHPVYCPQPVLVAIHGSTRGDSRVKVGFIGRGMRLKFHHPENHTVITSPIKEIRECPDVDSWSITSIV